MTHSDTATLPNGALIAAIPRALRDRAQWVLWRYEDKPDRPGELTKMPYTDIGRRAQSNNPRTWLSFGAALTRWRTNPNGWAGIGFVFSKDDPFTGIDLDSCLNPETGIVASWADAELTLVLPTYAEISPSRAGIKLIVETTHTHTLGSGKDKDSGQLEVYSANRFFAITGRAFEDAPPEIAPIDDAIIEHMIAREQARRAARQPQQTRQPPASADTQRGANGTYPPLTLSALTRLLDRLSADRWAAYDDWLRIGMALHAWADGDPHRLATAFALYDQYSKESVPDLYGETAEKWASFGKRNGDSPLVTIGTLIAWAEEDSPREAQPEGEPPHPAGHNGIEPTIEIESAIIVAPTSSFPELPPAAHIDMEVGRDACPWLDDYIAFSRQWSPRSYDDFHEACGLWILSTVAARRVMLPLGGARYTSLYIALCARTSLWAKSTVAKIAIDVIRAAGLSHLLAPDNATPQAFIRDLAEKIPAEWGELPPTVQEERLLRLAFAGQKGWFYEEYGEHLAAMMRDGSAMADYRGHFRRFDDCPPSYSYSTIGRGVNIVQRPYLALIANLTPADLAPFAKKGGALWGDGFFARYAFVTPASNAERSRERFPDGWRTVPDRLSRPLRTWHEQLGIPVALVDERLDQDDKPAGYYTLNVESIEPQRCTLGPGVFDAYYRYLDALADLVDSNANADLDGSYTRFAEKALRIAMLLASFSNGGRIAIDHWARAQAITERWRRSLHHLIDQLGMGEESPERQQEDKLDRLLAQWPEGLTARDVGRYLHISSSEAESLLTRLARVGKLQIDAGKRTKRYRLLAGSVATVTSQASQYAEIVTVAVNGAGVPGTMREELSQNKEGVTVCHSDSCDTFHNKPFPLVDNPGASLRLRTIDPDLYATGWRAATDSGGYIVFHPARGERTSLYAALEAAARAAKEQRHDQNHADH